MGTIDNNQAGNKLSNCFIIQISTDQISYEVLQL